MMIQKRKQELLPHEVFALLENTKNVTERVRILIDNESYSLKTILQLAFHPGIIMDLPEGAPPFKESKIPDGMQNMSMRKQVEILPRLLVSNTRITKMKKEMLFVRFLEEISLQDANIVIAAKDKKLTTLFPLVTLSLVRKAFPKILPTEV